MSSQQPVEKAVLDPSDFRAVCSKFATGVMIATVIGADGKPHGMTVNSFTSVSLQPPLVLFCVDQKANVLGHFLNSSYFALNILAEGRQDLSERFAQRGYDRFEGIDWRPGVTGCPLLDSGIIGYLECSVAGCIEAGDHIIFIGQVLHGEAYPGKPLLFFESSYGTFQPLSEKVARETTHYFDPQGLGQEPDSDSTGSRSS